MQWGTRGAWLLQVDTERGNAICTGIGCQAESMHVLLLLFGLCSSVVMVMCALCFFREDKEEQITPLCASLVVKDAELVFSFPLGPTTDRADVVDEKGKIRCKVIIDWPDPFRPGSNGVAATARVHGVGGELLSTVVARNVAPQGQSLALLRFGYEIFGYVEPENHPARRFHVKTRSGVYMMSLAGDFNNIDIDIFNPVGVRIGTIAQVGDEIHGRITQHMDAGLVLSSFIATYFNRRLTMTAATQAPPVVQVDERALRTGTGETEDPIEFETDSADPMLSSDGPDVRPVFHGRIDADQGSNTEGTIGTVATFGTPLSPRSMSSTKQPVEEISPVNSPQQEPSGCEVFANVDSSEWFPGKVTHIWPLGVAIDVDHPSGGDPVPGIADASQAEDGLSDGTGLGLNVGQCVRVRVLSVDKGKLTLSLLPAAPVVGG